MSYRTSSFFGAIGSFFSDAADKFKGLSKKKRGILICVCVACVAVIAGCVIAAVKPEPAVEVSAVEVSNQNIQQTITVSGTVKSTSQSTYYACDGVSVSEVSVAVGDSVEAGQQLAAFDVSPLEGKVDEKLQAYTQSKQTYDDSIVQAEKAKEQLPAIEKRIAELQAQVDAESSSGGGSQSEFSVEDILSNFSLDTLTDMFSNITSGFDMSSIMGGNYSDAETELVELQAKKLVLESQASNTMLSVYKALVNSTEKEYEAYKAAYEALSAGWTAEEAGIVTAVNVKAGQSFAVADGETKSVDISAVLSQLESGVDVGSLLSSASDVAAGIVIDNYSGFRVEFNINQYDISKISIGQTADISIVNNTTAYSGTVSYISAKMSDGSGSIDIGSIASSLTGGSSSSGLDAEATVTNPDKNMIIGMTVDMDIQTSYAEGAVAVPIEAIYLDGSDVYVFVIENNKAYKKPLEVGISSNTLYQVISGCEVGDVLVKNPTSTLTDGARVKVKTGE